MTMIATIQKSISPIEQKPFKDLKKKVLSYFHLPKDEKTNNFNSNLISTQCREFKMQGGMTNKFFVIEDSNKKKYLLRANGKLWPPFTREAEHFNLTSLKLKKIETNVLKNDVYRGFQICKLYPQSSSLNYLQENLDKFIPVLAKQIVRYQKLIINYKNVYPLIKTIQSSFNRLNMEQRKSLQIYFEIILKMAEKIEQDKKEHVFSHNDLLLSSIYIQKNSAVIVDWEYAGENHRFFDIAFIVVKNKLDQVKEDLLIKSYCIENFNENKYSIEMLKSIISFMFLQWELAKSDSPKKVQFFVEFYDNLKKFAFYHSYRSLKNDLFISSINIQNDSKKNLDWKKNTSTMTVWKLYCHIKPIFFN